MHVLINFIIDRKAAIDIIENIPTKYKEKQFLLHLDTVLKIAEILKQKTAKTLFIHYYSHVKDHENDHEKVRANKEKLNKLITKFGEEKAIRYIEGNDQADKLADKEHLNPNIFTPKFNKYQNTFLLHSTRQKKLKDSNYNQTINSRIRHTLKETIRDQFSNKLLKKEKYNKLNKNKENINKLSQTLIRDKLPENEKARTFMVRLLHGALPTCEKMDRLVKSERENSVYYKEKYGYHANEGQCPCCGKETETTRHLFIECDHEQIKNLRKKIPKSIYEVVKNAAGQTAVDTSEIDFVYTNVKKNKDIKKWDRELGNYGLVPHHTVKYIDSLLEEDEKNQLKRIITRISVKIMEINIEIWKYRCKILYSGNAAIT